MFGIKKRRAPLFGGVAAEDDKDIEVQRAREVARHSFWAEARLLLRDLIFALMFAALLVVFVVQPVKVEGTSMLPRLHDGERIFVNKLIYYGLPELQRGDIVVFWYPEDPSKSYIKRIIGLPGETVELRDGRVYIISQGREQLLEEPYLDPQRNASRADHSPVEVKQHYYFVMGDNRDASSDSRIWGLVPEKYIYGKALFRYWPLGSISFISHESDYNIQSPPRPRGAEPAADGGETQ
ncbi:MAG TPA: signal peptidase I [Pyrinomonadaceae bacterium]|nr:signal peptidase I [Pyrinomonadaceae bacterium]